MKAVILWELRRRRWFIIWWAIGIACLIAITVLSYKAIRPDAAQLNKTFSSLASGSGGFFGGSDFFSPVGYMSSQIYYILLPILVIIMSVVLASGLMNRDEDNGTVEYTLARAISRRELLLAKAIAGLIVVAIVALLTYIVTVVVAGAAGLKLASWALLSTHLLAFVFSASFGIIAFALMAAGQLTRKIAASAAIALALGGYVISSLADLVHWLKVPAKLMPYHYYDTVGLLNGNIKVGLIIYLGAIFVGAIAVAAVGYERRDIG